MDERAGGRRYTILRLHYAERSPWTDDRSGVLHEAFSELGYDKNTAGRYGMIENIDDNFGVLMKKLDQWNLWEDTLVIFMTDIGQAGRAATLNGERVTLFTAGFKTKGSPYEGGTHVPAFWRWKGRLGRASISPH